MVNEEPKATTNNERRQIAIERLVATEIRLTPYRRTHQYLRRHKAPA